MDTTLTYVFSDWFKTIAKPVIGPKTSQNQTRHPIQEAPHLLSTEEQHLTGAVTSLFPPMNLKMFPPK
jgi:hypothetical protein